MRWGRTTNLPGINSTSRAGERETDMYGIMVAFDPTRATLVSGGRNEGLNFGNVVANSKSTGDRDHGGGSGIGRKLKFWHCGGEHLKRNCLKRTKEEEEEEKRMTEAPKIKALS